MVVIEIQTTDRPLPHFHLLRVESRELFCLLGRNRMAELVRGKERELAQVVLSRLVFLKSVSKVESSP